MKVSPAFRFQGFRVDWRRAVEGDLISRPRERFVVGALIRPGRDHALHRDTEIAPRPSTGLEAFAERRERRLLDERGRRERNDDEPVCELAGGPRHRLPDRPEHQRGRPVRVWLGREHRLHLRMTVVLALIVEPLAGLPGTLNRANRADHVAHPGDGLSPRHAEALFDVLSSLGSEAENEAAFGQHLKIVRLVRERQWVSRECHRDLSAERFGLGVLRRDCERQEPVARALEGVHPVVSDRSELLDLLFHGGQIVEDQTTVDFHRRARDGWLRIERHRHFRMKGSFLSHVPYTYLTI